MHIKNSGLGSSISSLGSPTSVLGSPIPEPIPVLGGSPVPISGLKERQAELLIV